MLVCALLIVLLDVYIRTSNNLTDFVVVVGAKVLERSWRKDEDIAECTRIRMKETS